MTLLIVLILAAVLVVVGIYLIKNTAKNKVSGSNANPTQVNTAGPTPPSPNPGSIPDQRGTKGDGGSALSSGQQG